MEIENKEWRHFFFILFHISVSRFPNSTARRSEARIAILEQFQIRIIITISKVSTRLFMSIYIYTSTYNRK